MDRKNRLRKARDHIDTATELVSDPDIETYLDNLSRGVELVANSNRPVQPRNIQRISVQINSILQMTSEDEISEQLEQAKEHYIAILEDNMQ